MTEKVPTTTDFIALHPAPPVAMVQVAGRIMDPEIERLLDKVNEALTEFRIWVGKLVKHILKWRADVEYYLQLFDGLFDSAVATVRAVLDAVVEAAQQTEKAIADLVDAATAPLAMRDDIYLWREFQQKTGQLVEWIDPGWVEPKANLQGKASSLHWKGIAADAYRSTLPKQGVAMARLPNIANSAAAALSQCFTIACAMYGSWLVVLGNLLAIAASIWSALAILAVGGGDVRTMLRLVIATALVAEAAAAEVSRQQGDVLNIQAARRDGNYQPADGYWPDPFLLVGFINPQIGPNGRVEIQAGAPELHRQ